MHHCEAPSDGAVNAKRWCDEEEDRRKKPKLGNEPAKEHGDKRTTQRNPQPSASKQTVQKTTPAAAAVAPSLSEVGPAYSLPVTHKANPRLAHFTQMMDKWSVKYLDHAHEAKALGFPQRSTSVGCKRKRVDQEALQSAEAVAHAIAVGRAHNYLEARAALRASKAQRLSDQKHGRHYGELAQAFQALDAASIQAGQCLLQAMFEVLLLNTFGDLSSVPDHRKEAVWYRWCAKLELHGWPFPED
jgi:hypothetical protein